MPVRRPPLTVVPGMAAAGAGEDGVGGAGAAGPGGRVAMRKGGGGPGSMTGTMGCGGAGP